MLMEFYQAGRKEGADDGVDDPARIWLTKFIYRIEADPPRRSRGRPPTV
jgi:hypothetical protein